MEQKIIKVMKLCKHIVFVIALIAITTAAKAGNSDTPGLYEARLGGQAVYADTLPSPAPDRSILGPYGANAWGSDSAGFDVNYVVPDIWPPSTGGWGNHTTFIYFGYIYIPAGSNTATYAISFDDKKRLFISGAEVCGNGNADGDWNRTAIGTATFPTGWHSFYLIMDNGAGGFGPTGNWQTQEKGFAMRYGGYSNNPDDFFFPVDPGDGSLFSLEFPPHAVVLSSESKLLSIGLDIGKLETHVVMGTNATTTLRLYYGLSDAGGDANSWSGYVDYPEAITETGTYAITLTNLVANSDYYCRFATVDAGGTPTMAINTKTFPTVDSVYPEFGAIQLTGSQKTSVTLGGDLIAGFPTVQINAYIDTVDHGSDSLPEDWASTAYAGEVELAGSFSTTLSDLVSATDYFVRFYATNDNDAVWSAPIEVTTRSPSLRAIDQYPRIGGEGQITVATVPVSLDTPAGKPVSFRWYTVQPGDANCENAVPGVHYIEDSGLIVMPAGLTETNFTVSVLGNDLDEFPGKHFWVAFDSLTNISSTPLVEIGTLADFGEQIFYEDFSSGSSRWTAPRWDVWTEWADGNSYCRVGNDSKYAIAGNKVQSRNEYGMRVMCQGGIYNGWQGWGIIANNQESEGGGFGYMFRINNGGSGDYGGMGGRLYINGEFAAGIENVHGMDGSRVGIRHVSRPLSIRITKTPEGHNRVRCWAGYSRAIDYIDESGELLEGGKFGIINEGWNELWFDTVEVFRIPPDTILIVR